MQWKNQAGQQDHSQVRWQAARPFLHATLPIRFSPGPGESDAKPSLGQVAKGCGGFPFLPLSFRTTASPLPRGEKLLSWHTSWFDLFCAALPCLRHSMNITKIEPDISWKPHAHLKNQDTNAIHLMIPFVWNVQNKPVHTDSMQMNGCQRLGEKGS